MSDPELSGAARRRRELWLNIADHAADFLMRECDVEEQKAIDAADALVKRLIDLLAGSSVYFARDYSFELTKRDEEIADRLERGNANDLAVEYGISFVHVYTIARQVRARRAAKAKADMAAQAEPATTPRRSMYTDLVRHLGGDEN